MLPNCSVQCQTCSTSFCTNPSMHSFFQYNTFGRRVTHRRKRHLLFSLFWGLSHVWKHLALQACAPELCGVKPCIRIEKEARCGDSRGFEVGEEFPRVPRRCCGGRCGCLIREWTQQSVFPAYQWCICRWWSFFSCVLDSHSIPRRNGQWCGCRPSLHRTCPEKVCTVPKSCPTTSAIRRSWTICGNVRTRFCNAAKD